MAGGANRAGGEEQSVEDLAALDSLGPEGVMTSRYVYRKGRYVRLDGLRALPKVSKGYPEGAHL